MVESDFAAFADYGRPRRGRETGIASYALQRLGEGGRIFNGTDELGVGGDAEGLTDDEAGA